VTTTGAPAARVRHTAVWTGTEMIVWGGSDGFDQVASGGRYDPATDAWTSTAATDTPRDHHTAVWSTADSRMLIYGGIGDPPGFENLYLPSPSSTTPGGQRYDPSGNSWQPLNNIAQPAARANHTAIYDGASMIVWGGFDGTTYLDTGARYTANAWTALAGTAPEGRAYHTAVWIAGAQRMVIWGGSNTTHTYLHTGAEYSTETHSWLGPTPTAPEGRRYHTAVSTGDAMVIWGGRGLGGVRLADGAIYTPMP
jgi:N-acetylneuraminic acid mutarotase